MKEQNNNNNNNNLNNISFSSRLHDCNITERGCLMLSTLLSSQSNVRELDVSNNKLQDTGVEIFSVGLKKSCYARPLYASMEYI